MSADLDGPARTPAHPALGWAAAWLAVLATITASPRAEAGLGVALGPTVAASAGGHASGGGLTLGFTVGETVVGLSLTPSVPATQIAGFWGVGSGPVLDAGEGHAGAVSDRLSLAVAPNPFTTGTQLQIMLPSSARAHPVRLQIFDPNGRLVRAFALPRGTIGRQSIAWDGRDGSGRRVPVGLYHGLLEAGPFRERRRIAHVR